MKARHLIMICSLVISNIALASIQDIAIHFKGRCSGPQNPVINIEFTNKLSDVLRCQDKFDEKTGAFIRSEYQLANPLVLKIGEAQFPTLLLPNVTSTTFGASRTCSENSELTFYFKDEVADQTYLVTAGAKTIQIVMYPGTTVCGGTSL